MTTFNTGNPLGSTDVYDRYDNSENLDKFTNGPLDAYPDRFGVSRQSWAGMEAEFDADQVDRAAQWAAFLLASGYQVLGPYGAGLVFTAPNQVFSYLGEFYSPGPSIVLPYTTTGAGAAEIANFRSVGDAVLRQDLANAVDPEKGAALVARTTMQVSNIPALRTTRGRSAGDSALVSAYSTLQGYGGGTFFFEPGNSSPDNGVTVITAEGGGRWVRKFDGPYFASWSGVSQANADNSSQLKAIVDIAKTRKFTPNVGNPVGVIPVVYGVREVKIDSDRVNYSTTLLVDGNIELSSYSSQAGTILDYSGTGNAIVVNSTQADDFTTAPQLAQAVTFRGLHIKAYSGASAVFVGAATLRDVQFYGGSVSGVTLGTGLFFGEAAYGATVEGFDIHGCSIGIHFNDYCDIMTIRNCWIGGNTGAGILVEGPTYNIENNNIESNSGIPIQIIYRPGNINELRAGRISGNRFGDEAEPLLPNNRDIELTRVPGATGAITGVVIENNKFFSNPVTPKEVPILINSPVSLLNIRGNIKSDSYTSGYLVSATTEAYATGANFNSTIDDITQVAPSARALFAKCDNKTFARFIAASEITAGYPVEVASSSDSTARCQSRSNSIALGDTLAQKKIVGVADFTEVNTGRPVWIRTKGAIVPVAITYSPSNDGLPIYMGFGVLTMTPPAGAEPFVVGIAQGGSGGTTNMLVVVG